MRIATVLASATRAGVRYWRRILPVALVVSLLSALAEIAVGELDNQSSGWLLALIVDLGASGISLLAAVFLSGFLCRLVAGDEEEDNDRAEPTAWEVLRSLPWARLAGADLLVTLLVVIGLLALVVPGLVALGLLAVVGPVIEIENRKIIAALRRSAHLTRRHFWTVTLLVTVPVAAASEIDVAGPEPANVRSVLVILAIRGVAAALAEAAVGLIVVKLSHRLIVLDRAQG